MSNVINEQPNNDQQEIIAEAIATFIFENFEKLKNICTEKDNKAVAPKPVSLGEDLSGNGATT